MDIGQRIADLRKKRGMTQEQLAEALGATRQAVSKWESGKSAPDMETIIRMGVCFGVTMDYLILGVEGPAFQAPPQPKKRLEGYKIVFIIGACLACLLPLIADLYCNYIFLCKGVAHSNPNVYLHEWPLLGVTWINYGLLLYAHHGWAQANRERLKAWRKWMLNKLREP